MISVEKKCPYCAEMIKVEAIKCRYCHSNLVKSDQQSEFATREEAIRHAFTVLSSKQILEFIEAVDESYVINSHRLDLIQRVKNGEKLESILLGNVNDSYTGWILNITRKNPIDLEIEWGYNAGLAGGACKWEVKIDHDGSVILGQIIDLMKF